MIIKHLLIFWQIKCHDRRKLATAAPPPLAKEVRAAGQWGSDIGSGQITAAGAGYTYYDSNICRQGTFTNTGIQQQVSFCIIIAYTTIN